MKKKAVLIGFAVVIIVIMLLTLIGLIDNGIGVCLSLSLIIIYTICSAYSAFKNDVAIIGYFMVFLTIIGIVILGYDIIHINNSSLSYKFQITVSEDGSSKKYLFEYDGRNYYSYGVSDVNVIMEDDGNTYTLENALSQNYITLDEILSLAAVSSDTVGYKIYYDGGQAKYENDTYSIVVCQNETKDVIFGTFNYEYEDGLCD